MRRLVGRRFEKGARVEPHQGAVAVLTRGQEDDPRTFELLGAPPARECVRSAKSTASAQPTIGWIPAAAILSENSSAPNMLSVSVSASAGWRSALASSHSRAIVNEPWSRE